MMAIPLKLKNLLNGVADELSAAVGSAFASIMPLLQRNEATFFPDYTDHGISHVESVLSSCELLIADDAWNVFTREDATVLILATLAHDLGMLINVEGFSALVESNVNDIPNNLAPTDEPWNKLWREFQLDARRFDGATLINIVGSPDTVSIHELNTANFTERGIKIAGEFVRRHHHRLAHEIVVFGMPSEKGRIPLFESVPKHLREMAGIIARSHGVPIRECIEQLIERDRTSHREYRHIHSTFLMALVRLADYLDLDAGRAPSSILSVKSLKSPISRREWWSHKAIVDCHSHTDDPESLHVVVEPSALPDIATFSVIEEKIKGIQKEIDASWAVLGEVYGRFPPLNRLSLRIRRIRSDIRLSSTINQLPFVPYKAALESARADLLKLLIEPLYGDHPGVGIRELVQNSLDAVRELEFILSGSTPIRAEYEPLDGDVSVYFEKDDSNAHWVVIADRGIGMTWMTVCKYYLTAGASFRQSEAWKKRFSDEEGSSQVLRSGRFGIGVLAAFLIGDRVQVSTRHVDQPEDKGVLFEFGLDDTFIEMKWLSRSVGTTVRVRTTESVINRLIGPEWQREVWDWYCLEKPVVTRKDNNGKLLTQKHKLPGLNSKLPVYWHKLNIPGLQAVHWTFREKYPELVCNGILIPNGKVNIHTQFDKSKYYEIGTHLIPKSPHISVYDPDGKLPLNLARDRLAGTYAQLNEELADDLCRNLIAYALVHGPKSRMLIDDQFYSYCRPSYPGFVDWYNGFGYFYDTPHGFGISDPWNISSCSPKIGLLLKVNKQKSKATFSSGVTKLIHDDYDILLGDVSYGRLTEYDSWHKLLALSTYKSVGLGAFKGIELSGIRIALPHEWYKRFISKQPQYNVKAFKIEVQTDAYIIICKGECSKDATGLNNISNELIQSSASFESLTECFFSPVNELPEPGRIARFWKEVIGAPILPFDVDDRQVIITRLGPEFNHHIEEWSRPDAVSRRRINK